MHVFWKSILDTKVFIQVEIYDMIKLSLCTDLHQILKASIGISIYFLIDCSAVFKFLSNSMT